MESGKCPFHGMIEKLGLPHLNLKTGPKDGEKPGFTVSVPSRVSTLKGLEVVNEDQEALRSVFLFTAEELEELPNRDQDADLEAVLRVIEAEVIKRWDDLIARSQGAHEGLDNIRAFTSPMNALVGLVEPVFLNKFGRFPTSDEFFDILKNNHRILTKMMDMTGILLGRFEDFLELPPSNEVVTSESLFLGKIDAITRSVIEGTVETERYHPNNFQLRQTASGEWFLFLKAERVNAFSEMIIDEKLRDDTKRSNGVITRCPLAYVPGMLRDMTHAMAQTITNIYYPYLEARRVES